MNLETQGTIYQISSAKAKSKTKLLVFAEAKGTIINLIIGENVQTYIKIKTSDIISVLEEMGLTGEPTTQHVLPDSIELV